MSIRRRGIGVKYFASESLRRRLAACRIGAGAGQSFGRRLMRAQRFARFSLAAAILAATALSGCGKDSPTKPKALPPLYSIPSSPAVVLANLEVAYSQR